MTHPMRPTAEQLNEWLAAALEAHPNGRVALIAGHVAHQAYAAGADDELEECAELLRTGFPGSLHGARRPAPPTPQQAALNALDQWGALLPDEVCATIRQGLEVEQ